MTATFVLTVLLMIQIHIGQSFMLGNAILMAAYGFVPAIICTVICVFQIHALFKAGFCTAISGITLYCANRVATGLFGPSSSSFYQVDFHNWEQCLNGNVQLIVLLSFLFLSAVFFVIGFFRVMRNKKDKVNI